MSKRQQVAPAFEIRFTDDDITTEVIEIPTDRHHLSNAISSNGLISNSRQQRPGAQNDDTSSIHKDLNNNEPPIKKSDPQTKRNSMSRKNSRESNPQKGSKKKSNARIRNNDDDQIKDYLNSTSIQSKDGIATPPVTPPRTPPIIPTKDDTAHPNITDAINIVNNSNPINSTSNITALSLLDFAKKSNNFNQSSTSLDDIKTKKDNEQKPVARRQVRRATISHDDVIVPTVAKKLKMNGQLPFANHDALLGVTDEPDSFLTSSNTVNDISSPSLSPPITNKSNIIMAVSSATKATGGDENSQKDSRKKRREEFVLMTNDDDEEEIIGEGGVNTGNETATDSQQLSAANDEKAAAENMQNVNNMTNNEEKYNQQLQQQQALMVNDFTSNQSASTTISIDNIRDDEDDDDKYVKKSKCCCVIS
ncbi:15965_t:CDS:2 [Entrophospora sp. SA101]|nr:15965_t:CDS:2 [Entrophospora sp. SA101]CAJ0870262.1 10244_t:CDS:2 [Entrophospora sp. SA101]